MSGAPPADAAARLVAVSEFERDLVVTAGAGSGKTSLLVERLLTALLQRGESLADFAAITFTRKAAAELQDRLAEELHRALAIAEDGAEARTADAAGRLWLRLDASDRAPVAARARARLARLEEATLTTLHSFCAALLRRHPLASRLAPGFQEDDGEAFRRLFHEAGPRVVADSIAAIPEPHRSALSAWSTRHLLAVARAAASAPAAPIDAGQSPEWVALEIFAAAAGCRLRGLLVTAGWVSFDDLVVRARDLLARDDSVLRRERARWTEILVDELQDTDPRQYRILSLLCEPRGDEPRPRLFLVGDAKQSIYRFRNADLTEYTRFCERVLERGCRLSLTTNFRSRPEILAPVNALFAAAMEEDAGVQPGYEAIAAAGTGAGEPLVELLEVEADGLAEERRQQEARAVLAELLRLREDGLAWGEMLVLLPKFTGLPLLMHEMHAAGVPFFVDGGKSFFKRQEVADLAALLTAWCGPEDGGDAWPTAMLAFFRSSVGAVTDGELLRYAQDLDGACFGVPPRTPDRCPTVAAACDRLAAWRDQLRAVPEDEVPALLLHRSGLRAAWGLRRNGRQALANLEKAAAWVAEQVRGLGTSLAEAVQLLDERLGADEQADRAVSEEGAEAVGILTIHKAKGLERRAVIVAGFDGGELSIDRGARVVVDEDEGYAIRIDAERSNARYEDWQELDRRHLQAEKLRLLYVAFTRAKERLVLVQAVAAAGRSDVWLKALETGWGYRPREAPPARDDVRFRKIDAASLSEAPYDRAAPEPPVDAALAALARAERTRARAEARFAAPSSLGHEETLDAVPAGGEGELAAAAGTLLHALFEHWDYASLDTLATPIEPLADAAATAHGVDRGALLERARAVLGKLPGTPCAEHLLGLAAAERFPEWPILHAEEGRTFTGMIDLLHLRDGRWTVADFKSDRGLDAESARRRYGPQLRLYGRAVQRALALAAPPRLELLLLDTGLVVEVDAAEDGATTPAQG